MFVPCEAVPLNDTVVIDATCLDHLYLSNGLCVLVLSLNLYIHGRPESHLWPPVNISLLSSSFPSFEEYFTDFFVVFLCWFGFFVWFLFCLFVFVVGLVWFCFLPFFCACASCSPGLSSYHKLGFVSCLNHGATLGDSQKGAGQTVI